MTSLVLIFSIELSFPTPPTYCNLNCSILHTCCCRVLEVWGWEDQGKPIAYLKPAATDAGVTDCQGTRGAACLLGSPGFWPLCGQGVLPPQRRVSPPAGPRPPAAAFPAVAPGHLRGRPDSSSRLLPLRGGCGGRGARAGGHPTLPSLLPTPARSCSAPPPHALGCLPLS